MDTSKAFNKCLQLGNMVPVVEKPGSAVWTHRWVVKGVPLHSNLTGSQKWAWHVGPGCVSLCKSQGLTKPTYFCIADICYYCSCSAAADVTQLWISICEGAEDYALDVFSIHPAANSADFQGNLWRAIQMFRKLPALPHAVLCTVLLSCFPAWPPLPWEFIHPQPPQGMIVDFAFRIAVCVSENHTHSQLNSQDLRWPAKNLERIEYNHR